MVILLSLALFFVLALTLFYRQRVVTRLRSLEEMMDELAAGEIPATFLFRRTPHFSRVAAKLEKLSDEHARLRRQIEQEKWNFETVLASMVEGVLVTDAEGRIRLVNHSFRTMFGLPAEPHGQTVLGALRETSVDAAVRETLRGGGPQSREISLTQSGAAARHFEVNAVPLRDEKNDPSGVVAIFHDISRLRQLEEVRRDFVANVSHELRTPLTIFQGYLENLRDEPEMPPEELAEILRIMSKHSRRLLALLKDLLILARLESRRDEIDVRDIVLAPFLKNFIAEWRPRFAARGISADVRVMPDAISARADEGRLEQVLGNLLDNAIKFSPSGGTVTISVTSPADADEQRIELRVEDSGAGIPASDLPHIFERFYRVEKARTRGGADAGGTGLGLSIVKHIVALHGGSVRAESVFGRGTAIIVSLPRGS